MCVSPQQKEITEEIGSKSLYETFAEDILPLAIEVGMTPNQFWYDDIQLLDVYIKAYNSKYEKSIEELRIGGHYVNLAVISAIRTMFGEGKGFQYLELIKKEKESITETKETKEKDFNEKKNFWSSLKHRKD